MTIDPTADSPDSIVSAPNSAPTEEVVRLARKLREAGKEISLLEQTLSYLKVEKFKLETEDLPAAMDSCGVSSFTLSTGETIKVDPFYQGTVPTLGTIGKAKGPDRDKLMERRQFTLGWMREHNHHGLIKNEVSVSFGKGQDDLAERAVRALVDLDLSPSKEESVHPSTFISWIKEMKENGVALPLDEMGVFVGRKASLSKPK